MRYDVWVRGLAVALLLFFPMIPIARAQAPEGGVVFSWVRAEGAETCPDRAALADEVRSRLGYDPFQPPFGQALEGVVARTDEGWTVTLYSRDADGALVGRRDLPSAEPECAALAEAVALAMALAIDPEAALRAPEPAPAPVSAPASASPPASATAAAPEPTPGHVRLSAGATGGVDVVPGLGVAARVTIDGPILPILRWYGAVAYWAEQVATLDDASFGVGLVTFSAGLCAGARFDFFRVDGCVSIDVGAAHAVVYSPTPRAPGERVYAGATALLRAELELFHPLWLGVHAGGVVPFVVHEYRVQGRDEIVFSQSPVGPIAGAELAVRFD